MRDSAADAGKRPVLFLYYQEARAVPIPLIATFVSTEEPTGPAGHG
jgi:hypothetical protein